MQHQTVPQTSGTYRIAFDSVLGVEPLTIPAPATVEDIAKQVRDAFKASEWSVTEVAVDLAGGQVTLIDHGGPFEWASINHEQPKPDYWLTLADAIRQHADRIATLAGTDWKPTYAGLSISMANPGNKNAIAGDMVDVVADTFGLTAKTVKSPGGYHTRTASGHLDGLQFSVYGYVPAPADPDDPEKAAMRAELEELRAQLAEGGAAR